MEFGGASILQVIILVPVLFMIVWPFIHPFKCKEVTRGQRFTWFCCSLFFGFLGYGLYYVIRVLLKPKKEPFTWPTTTSEQWMRHQS